MQPPFLTKAQAIMKLRQQYHFRESEKGLMSWDVLRLIKLTSKLQVKLIPLAQIQELDEQFWYGLGTRPTCRSVAEHAKLINEVDLSYPIILCPEGRVMDGMHRVCRALIEGHDSIKAVQLETEVEPDYIGVLPDDLPY